MRVLGAAVVVFLGLSGGVFGADCEVPEGHTDPEVISPVKHQPTAGKICEVAANYEVTVRRCELRYCCSFRCTCHGAVYVTNKDCPGLFTQLSCYVEHKETHLSIKVCCSGYEQNDKSVCIKIELPQPPLTTSTESQETFTKPTTSLANVSVSPETLTKSPASTHTTGATADADSGSGPRLWILLMAAMLIAVVLVLTVVTVTCFVVRHRRRPSPPPPSLPESDRQINLYVTPSETPAAVVGDQIEMWSSGGRNTSFLEAGRTRSGPRTMTANSAGQVDTSGYLVPAALVATMTANRPQGGGTLANVDDHIYDEID